MPSGGNWTDLKREATEFVKSGSSSDAARLLGQFIRVNGGSAGWASGRGDSKGGGGRSSRATIIGGGARQTGRNLGSFLARTGSDGLAAALEELGLTKLVGYSATEVSIALLNVLAGPASTLDDSAARLALAALLQEILGTAKPLGAVERALNHALDKIGVALILTRFFALYLYECFCRNFYETWARKVGERKAKSQLRAVKNCIVASLRAKIGIRDPMRVRWNGHEGQKLAQNILQETLEIFGGEA